MKTSFWNKTFIVGFLTGMLMIIVLNLLSVMNANDCQTCNPKFGFPFSFYERVFTKCNSAPDRSADIECFIWYFSSPKLVANILIAIIFSFIVGLIFKFIWEESQGKSYDKL